MSELRKKHNKYKMKLQNKLNTKLDWEEYFNILFYGEKRFPLIDYKGGKK